MDVLDDNAGEFLGMFICVPGAQWEIDMQTGRAGGFAVAGHSGGIENLAG